MGNTIMSDFHCKQCGACCKTVGDLVPFMPIMLSGIFSPKANGECQHLQQDAAGKYICAIYEARPNICRVDMMAKERARSMGVSYEYLIKLASDACIIVRSM